MEAVVGLTRFLAKSQDLREALQAVVRCITDSLPVQQCQIILAREGDAVGHVAASSSPANDAHHSEGIDLEALPEIEQVLCTGATLVTSVSEPRDSVLTPPRKSNTAFSIAWMPLTSSPWTPLNITTRGPGDPLSIRITP